VCGALVRNKLGECGALVRNKLGVCGVLVRNRLGVCGALVRNKLLFIPDQRTTHTEICRSNFNINFVLLICEYIYLSN